MNLNNEEEVTVRHGKYRRLRLILLTVLMDLALIAASMLTFAYFHHVRPTAWRSENIVTNDDDKFGADAAKFGKINIEKKTMEGSQGKIVYYVADIYVSSVDMLETFLAENADDPSEAYGNFAEDTFKMARQSDAVIAINGDFYGFQRSGLVVRNGVLHRATNTTHDVCVLYYDGTMHTYLDGKYPSREELTEKGAYQAWTFGPSLLDDEGHARTDLAELSFCSGIYDINPRSALGYYQPGHYCFVVVDGRQDGYSVGADMTELAEIFEELGCTAAYNMDGGRSSIMVYRNGLEYFSANLPYRGGREVSDIILITGDNTDVKTWRDN